jgi:hypothetical protein
MRETLECRHGGPPIILESSIQDQNLITVSQEGGEIIGQWEKSAAERVGKFLAENIGDGTPPFITVMYALKEAK